LQARQGANAEAADVDPRSTAETLLQALDAEALDADA
jgi:hypothetical protein